MRQHRTILAIVEAMLMLGALASSMPAASNLVARDDAIPQYVLDYAPLCWLDSKEAYWPSSLVTHLDNIHPTVNATNITDAPSPLTLDNLNDLNGYGDGGIDTYLTSDQGIDANPEPSWLSGVQPDSSRSAPGGVIIVADKGSGTVDAFYFYFYSYNLGNWVLGLSSLELGDHVGDWEHNMIRFVNGEPSAMYFSQHSGGQAFTFSAVDKDSSTGRPINYPARGTHANYPTSGQHDHTIPGLDLPVGALLDYTSQGTLWDPLSQALFFTYNVSTSTFASPTSASTGFLSYVGHWGDQQLPDSNSNQKDVFSFRKYVDGPTGPEAKNLARTEVCESTSALCIVSPILL